MMNGAAEVNAPSISSSAASLPASEFSPAGTCK
jgi:hypothetical protein